VFFSRVFLTKNQRKKMGLYRYREGVIEKHFQDEWTEPTGVYAFIEQSKHEADVSLELWDALEEHDFSEANVAELTNFYEGPFCLNDPRLPLATTRHVLLKRGIIIVSESSLQWEQASDLFLEFSRLTFPGAAEGSLERLFPVLETAGCDDSIHGWRLPRGCRYYFSANFFTLDEGVELLRDRPQCMALNISILFKGQADYLVNEYRHRTFKPELVAPYIPAASGPLSTYLQDAFDALYQEQHEQFLRVVMILTKCGMKHDPIRFLYTFLFL
jgi:hypothetical protein